jgi:DNA-3-methyladenine glycosylase
MNKLLPRQFYQRTTEIVAHDLLGKKVVRTLTDGTQLSGIIVETEAYSAEEDSACHAYRGKTAANQALFGPVGHAYIYFIYGNHFCLNVVARSKESKAGGVLIRALEPIAGIEKMKQFRKTDALKNLTNGPGKLAQALHITKELYGADVTKEGPLNVSQGIDFSPESLCASSRIGISKAQEKEWRFYVCANPFVSK